MTGEHKGIESRMYQSLLDCMEVVVYSIRPLLWYSTHCRVHITPLYTWVGHVSCTGQYGGVGAACPLCGVQCLLYLQYVCVAPPTVAIQAHPHLLTSPLHNTSSRARSAYPHPFYAQAVDTLLHMLLCIPNGTRCRNSTYLLLTVGTSKVLVGTV